jgi:epoxyqueuosine reductase
MGNRVYGCDDCQDVCPWNRFAHEGSEAFEFSPRSRSADLNLIEFLSMTDAAFRNRFKGSPVLRAKRSGFVRNVAVALGNSNDAQAIPPLMRQLGDDDELVRGHVAWALGELGGKDATSALRKQLKIETVEWVSEEINAALGECS